MVDNHELVTLIHRAREAGAIVHVDYDYAAFKEEGRRLVSRVQVHGARGVGPFPMAPIAAAEALRRFLANPRLA